jgi:hypothetical protein
MVFEVVAIAILSLHRDTYNIRNLEKQWSANEIIPAIENLNPNFFPHAVTVDAPLVADIKSIVDIEEAYPVVPATPNP